MTRAPFATFREAADLADVVRAAPGWRVLLVRGDAPGGPAITRPNATRTWDRARNVRRVPPAIHAITPTGRRVTIGSRARWEALQ